MLIAQKFSVKVNSVGQNLQRKQIQTNDFNEIYWNTLAAGGRLSGGNPDRWLDGTEWEDFVDACISVGLEVELESELIFKAQDFKRQIFEAIGQETDIERLAALLKAADEAGYVHAP